MNSKLVTAILALLALSTSVSAQISPQGNRPLGNWWVPLPGIPGGDDAIPAFLVLGFSLLPYQIDLPGGNRLAVSPDVVTIFDPNLQLPADLPDGVIFYAQKLTLRDDGGSTSSSFGVDGGSALPNTLRLPRLGGIAVGTPGDT